MTRGGNSKLVAVMVMRRVVEEEGVVVMMMIVGGVEDDVAVGKIHWGLCSQALTPQSETSDNINILIIATF